MRGASGPEDSFGSLSREARVRRTGLIVNLSADSLFDPCKSAPFWQAHPEYRLSQEGTFDFAFPEVREYHLALAEELLERYDADRVAGDPRRRGAGSG